MKPLASVVIRAKNEAASIGRLLDILQAQTIADRLELIVVDSGSDDGTPDIVRHHGVEPIEIPAASFTFGGALNTGCEAAAAPIIVALSAHAFPPDEHWAEKMVAAFDDERVAAAWGDHLGPDGEPLHEAVLQDEEHARRHPFWGYSNPAGGFRAALWRERPWRADMPACEDKEWAWHWLQRGWLVRIDPALAVEHDHSHDPLKDVFDRSRREFAGYSMYLDLPPLTLPKALKRWWADRDGHSSAARARLSPWRAAKIAGEWAALRRTTSARTGGPSASPRS
jgi:rhamnosyltransferase